MLSEMCAGYISAFFVGGPKTKCCNDTDVVEANAHGGDRRLQGSAASLAHLEVKKKGLPSHAWFTKLFIDDLGGAFPHRLQLVYL